MSKNKTRENALLLDPNRQKIARQNAVLPGGPENNNPMNVTDIADAPVNSDSIYGDYRQNYPQMGTGMVNPMGIQRSSIPQQNPTAPGYNNVPYGFQNQPDSRGESPVWDAMEGTRLAGYGKAQGLPTAPMGLIGGPPIPGYIPGNSAGTDGPQFMPTSASLVPGSTPTKIAKKKGGKK